MGEVLDQRGLAIEGDNFALFISLRRLAFAAHVHDIVDQLVVARRQQDDVGERADIDRDLFALEQREVLRPRPLGGIDRHGVALRLIGAGQLDLVVGFLDARIVGHVQHHVARRLAEDGAAPNAVAQIVVEIVVRAQHEIVGLAAQRLRQRRADFDIDALETPVLLPGPRAIVAIDRDAQHAGGFDDIERTRLRRSAAERAAEDGENKKGADGAHKNQSPA